MQTITNTLGDASDEGHTASADGSIVSGLAYDNSGAGHQAFRWTAAGGMQGLGIYDADDMSSDGPVVSAVWTQSGGIQAPPPTLGGCCASVLGVSPDGSVVTGWSTTSSGLLHAFRRVRTAGGGLQDLGVTTGTESLGEDASANGAVVVGQARDRSDFWRAFRWTAAGGMRDIGTLGGTMSSSDSVSDDGSVIVGTSLTTSSSASDRALPLDGQERHAGHPEAAAQRRRNLGARMDPDQRQPRVCRRNRDRRHGPRPEQVDASVPRRPAASLGVPPHSWGR
jgi:probable HAF family extracellular repeat protein